MQPIALLIETATGFSTGLIEGIAAFARRHKRWELLMNPWGARESPRLPEHWNPAGVIARVTHLALARELDRLRVPVVNVSRSGVPKFDFPQVTVDERAVGIQAAEHLLDRGFRRLAYFGLTTQPNYIDRCGPAFAEAAALRGRECVWFRPPSNGKRARPAPTPQEQRDWLRALPKPVGVFAVAMEDARALAAACWAEGLAVPESVALLSGEDDRLYCTTANPPLSCLDLGPRQVGYAAAGLLGRLLSGRRPSQRPRLLPPRQLVVRRSTDTVAVEDADLACAVRYLREHATTPINVADVIRNAPLSRRRLEQRFRQVFGRSPAAEIRRLRLERAQALLDETDWSMPRIAAAAGFSQTEVMNQVFRRELRATPTEYRRRLRLD